jgi:hypothetical protein
VTPLTFVANKLAEMEEFDKAMPLFEEALQLSAGMNTLIYHRFY